MAPWDFGFQIRQGRAESPVHSLVRPNVIRGAAVAAIITTLACLPRLLGWVHLAYAAWFLVAVLAWASFILWSFVLGWHHRFLDSQPFVFPRNTQPWWIATVGGLTAASILFGVVDPMLRRIAPNEYPAGLASWAGMAMFDLAFVQLFVTFAPFDFFLRLFRKPWLAAWLAVVFGLFLLFLKIRSVEHAFSNGEMMFLFAGRLAIGGITAWLYWKAGTIPVLWFAFLLELRHLVAPWRLE